MRLGPVQLISSTSVVQMTSDDEIWKDRYDQVVLTPYTWLGQATQLLHCANLVLEKSSDGPLKGTYENRHALNGLHYCLIVCVIFVVSHLGKGKK